ncbi:uncharacterized protein BXIN_2196 [Babesia sp. Xinjiang]|uniref:uncharacterized protein n=1 Tax=Babesia sp. Xinjiang TaxID=462227 RepID=UPI000A23723C|nr:uncharacterized protein BXIN_2196 [Babesia sp. Xinjiang]ORM40353.1 hypothetical protein BXIN_2196 [Babesia sp. Xinjiang]
MLPRTFVTAALTAIVLGGLRFSASVFGEVPPSGNHDADARSYEWEYEDEAAVFIPLNASGPLKMDGELPKEISGIDKLTRIYTTKDAKKRPESKVISPKLLEYADEAMSCVDGVYRRIEKYNHMFAGKREELRFTLDRYTDMLPRMLEDKTGLRHLSFVRRYILHVAKVETSVRESDDARKHIMKEAATIYSGVIERYKTIKLDFERHYTTPGVVINSAVSSLMGIGEAYKLLVNLHQQMFNATEAFRLHLNRIRAASVYMFSYLLCLDVLYTEIMPLRMVAVQDVMVTKGSGEILESYRTNMINKRNAIKALMKSPTLGEKSFHEVDRILTEVSALCDRSKTIAKSVEARVERADREGIRTLNDRITRVVEVWNEHYKRPILMSTKLCKEYAKLAAMIDKIKENQSVVHAHKQSLYTMSTRCNELYAMAREVAGLGSDGVRPRAGGSRNNRRLDSPGNTYMVAPDNSAFVYDVTGRFVRPEKGLAPQSPGESFGLLPHLEKQPITTSDSDVLVPQEDMEDDVYDDHGIAVEEQILRGKKRGHDELDDEVSDTTYDRGKRTFQPNGESGTVSQTQTTERRIPTHKNSEAGATYLPIGDGDDSGSPGTINSSEYKESSITDLEADDGVSGGNTRAYGLNDGIHRRWEPSVSDMEAGSRGKPLINDDSDAALRHPIESSEDSTQLQTGWELLTLLRKLRDVRNGLLHYQKVLMSLRWEHASVPGAQESRLIIEEVHRIYAMYRLYQSNELARRAPPLG